VTDAAGNPALQATQSLTVDETAPNAPSTPLLAAASDSGVAGDNITNIALPSYAGTAEAGSTVNLFNGATMIGFGTADPITGAWSITTTTPLDEGVHSLTVADVDVAGNTSVASNPLSITIDTVGPSAASIASIVMSPSTAVLGVGGTVILTIVLNEPVIIDITHGLPSLTLNDGGTAGLIGINAAGTVITARYVVLPGQNTDDLAVTGLILNGATITDLAGNQADTTGVAINPAGLLQIQTSAPPTPAAPTLTFTSDSGVNSSDGITNVAQPTVSGNATTGDLITLYDTDGATVLGTSTAVAGNWSITSGLTLGDGLHSLTVTDTDVVGNTSTASAPLSITIDTSAPTIAITGPIAGDNVIDASKAAAGFAITGTTAALEDGQDAIITIVDSAGDAVDSYLTTVTDNSWSVTVTPTQALALANGSDIVQANVSDAAGNSAVQANQALNVIACYLAGTRILTDRGEVAVESISIGDRLITRSGATQPVKWIGRRSYVTRFVASDLRQTVLPIRFSRGSLGANLPKRDLFVSPEHAICLDDILIPAKNLVNGASIAYHDGLSSIEYFHIELPSHDVIYAEGTPAESWLDCGNRNLFTNVVDYLTLDLPPEQYPPKPCLPMVTDGPQLDVVREKLAAHITPAGFGFTTDPDLRLVADGITISGVCGPEHVYSFALAAVPNRMAIASRFSVPSEMEPGLADQRPLGVRITKIVLKSASLTIDIAHDDPSLCDGFHSAEARHRWTSGHASIPEQLLACLSGPTTVGVHLGGLGLQYATQTGGDGVVIPMLGEQRGGNLLRYPAGPRTHRGVGAA
jgi:hypothetical protein